MPAVVDRQPRSRAARGRAAREAPSRCPLHALARAEPDAAGVPARLLHRDRRLAEAADERVPADARTAPAGCRLRRRAARDFHQRRPDARAGSRGATDHLDQLRACHGAGGRPPLRLGRRWRGQRDSRRHRRHQLRRLRRALGAHTDDAGDLARRATDGPHHGLPGGRREEHRRGRRQHRLDRPWRAPARGAPERGGRPWARGIRVRRRAADGHRRLPGARVPRP